jgi:hypothetical protein
MTKNYYTPTDIIERARKSMDTIDLDPASCDCAQKIVKATKYYTEQDSGLDQPWFGNVWLNPPYSHAGIVAFSKKLKAEKRNIKNIVMLVNNFSVENIVKQFGQLNKFFNIMLIPNNRIKFYNELGKNTTNYGGNLILAHGGKRFTKKFIENFGDLGSIWSTND